MIYGIGGLVVRIDNPNGYIMESFETFRLDETEAHEPDLTIQINNVDKIEDPEGEIILEDNCIWFRTPQGGISILSVDKINRTSHFLLKADSEWKNVSISYNKTELEFYLNGKFTSWDNYQTFTLAGAAFRNRLIKNGGIQLHCSAIEVDGKGYAFSAPSGTGKSTQTRLWRELYGDEVTLLNDDRPAIRLMNDVPMLCGIPWSGATGIFINHIIPLAGLIMVERSPENSVKKLSVLEALPLLMPRCFLPYFDQDLMNRAMEILEKVITTVPVYLLKCRPDFEAVELTRKCIL